MRAVVFSLCLSCASEPPPAVQPAPAPEVAPAPPPPPPGPTRAEVLAEIGAKKTARTKVLGAGWTQVGTHLNERVLKPVCGGEVPHLGLAHDAEGGRLHAFDGRRMHVYDIVALVERAPERWTAWVALRGEDAPVHPIQVRRIERHITRWRGLPTGPDWASGATWLRDTEVGGLVRIEQLGCED